MATNYPTGIDTTVSTLPNPTATTTEDAAGNLTHNIQHSNENDAIRAVETLLGLNSTQTVPVSGGVLAGVSATASKWSAALTLNGVVIGGGAGGVPTSTAVGTAGQVLTSNGVGVAPTFQTGGAPSGAAGGDLGGTYPNPTVVSVANVTTGVLTVPNGGTNRATLTNHGVLVGAGTAAITQLAVGATGSVLQGTAGADPAFTTTPTLAGDPPLTFTTAVSRIVPGATSLALRNNANTLNNLLLTDAGVATFRAAVNVTSGGMLISDPGSATFALSVIGHVNSFTMQLLGDPTAGQSLGFRIRAGTNASDNALRIDDQTGATGYLWVYGDGGVVIGGPTGGSKGVGTLNMAGGLYFNNGIEILGTGTTGSGAALLGANAPSAHLAAPYQWLDIHATDGTACTVPIWQK